MKQEITREQWYEITEEQRSLFWDGQYYEDERFQEATDNHYYDVDIGKMIEFLGDYWFSMLANRYDPIKNDFKIDAKNLCDNLWGATKDKIRTLTT